MPAQYLVRFDDLCPTMNWTVWRTVEEILVDAGVRPILAVVPDNQDPQLQVEPANTSFWERVRVWQSRGWTIGLHGHQHRYVTESAGIVGRNRYSEFAGLPFQEQLTKLRCALAIFAREGVRPDIWVAPAHSFDCATLDALRQCGIGAVSDGYSMLPHTDSHGMFWAPQQLGRFRSMPGGVWTVCMHHNGWGAKELRELRDQLEERRGSLSSVPELMDRYARRNENWTDRLGAGLMTLARSSRLAVTR